MEKSGSYQNHGDPKAGKPSVSKGSFESPATFAPLADSATSVNNKSGHKGDGESK